MGSAHPPDGHPELVRELVDRIRERGPLPFDQFMQAALYHPAYGYYASGTVAIGGAGADFRTSPEVHPIFAEMLCRQVVEMYRRLGEPDPFRVVELGPGSGRLARAFLGRAGEIVSGAALASWEYHLVDCSPALVRSQQQTLQPLPGGLRNLARWSSHHSLADAPAAGVVLSNEFFDALPVARVQCTAGTLQELCVVLGEDLALQLQLREAQDGRLADYFRDYGAPLVEGQQAEAGLQALEWMDRIAGALRRGYVLTIDYGHPADVLYAPARMQGTLLSYRAHQVVDDPLRHIGQQDLTAHVNFTALERRGLERGLRAAPLRTQTQFLLALGILERLQEREGQAEGEVQRLRERVAAKELFVPGGMGETFQVLIQSRDAPLEGLSGLSSPWREPLA